ncbi:ABC-type cobalt transport system, ATPase component [Thermococcus kodakarensis KOD1]|uniref:ABC-type cobalt transport system, ATPase component n=1 Tax=Thermococcus kodakarensis (strain ATCC BAA-918 / JCM 12380 / KOD1) TaxID=69014 RepID=Q5JHD4_THEKO|nr:ABC transporter ATP-binding protein [Thermococcus kodakarensis]WCN28768.1 ABC transporter ATP-binding protein [Thermococcus kodakarensis]WCN31067.1 ABC transporter ATP-binding protein [Thermococcus kodakarensis]BAD84935.1 ABC-type cobalt transport system, ATPase component [Thermococcus kodakarensis KOD1]
MIEAENVHFAYNGKEVLRGIDFEMGQEIVALVGPNGSGKTTLAKHFNGLLKPSKGRVLVDGLDTREHTVAELSRLVGYVFQNPEHMFFEETVFNEVAFGPRNLGLSEEEVEERVKWALKSVGLEGFEDRTPYSLSGGEKQRLAIACVLAMKPKYLILDEPTTGLDARAEEEVVEVIRSLHESGHGILLITHDMDLVVRLAERVVLLHGGRKLFDGPVEEFFTAFDVEKYGLERPEVVELGERLGVGFVRSIEEILAKLGGEV